MTQASLGCRILPRMHPKITNEIQLDLIGHLQKTIVQLDYLQKKYYLQVYNEWQLQS
jgi:hypothetical protein